VQLRVPTASTQTSDGLRYYGGLPLALHVFISIGVRVVWGWGGVRRGGGEDRLVLLMELQFLPKQPHTLL